MAHLPHLHETVGISQIIAVGQMGEPAQSARAIWIVIQAASDISGLQWIQAQAVHAFIRGRVAAQDSEVAAGLQILYGGSMNPSNAAELLSQTDIDGGLIGGAALQAESFAGICEAAHALSA